MRTIEEVIAELRKDIHSDVYLGKKTINTYLDEILEIHKAESTQGDLISRSALRKDIEHLYSVYAENKDWFYTAVLDHIDNAPTVVNYYTKGFADGERSGRNFPLADEEKAMLVRQWRPHGEWIKYIRCIECSVCKDKFFADDEEENCQDYEPCTDLSFNFCPNCGADMRGEK